MTSQAFTAACYHQACGCIGLWLAAVNKFMSSCYDITACDVITTTLIVSCKHTVCTCSIDAAMAADSETFAALLPLLQLKLATAEITTM